MSLDTIQRTDGKREGTNEKKAGILRLKGKEEGPSMSKRVEFSSQFYTRLNLGISGQK